MPILSESAKLALIDRELDDYPDEVREFFLNLIANGQSPNMALILATRSAPVMKGGDRQFQESYRWNMNSMDAHNRKMIYQRAHEAGVKTDGKFYVGGLGRYTDQHAWCATAEDVLTQCKMRNLNADRIVHHKAVAPAAPPKRVPLAEHLIKECTQKLLANEPKTVEKLRKGKIKPQEIRERVIAKHGRKVKE